MKDDLIIGVGATLVIAGLIVYLINRGTNAISNAASSIGSAASNMASATVAAVGTAAQAVNPVNPSNIVNRGFESVGQAMTGDPNWSLGGSIYDWTHPNYSPSTTPTPLRASSPSDGYSPFQVGGDGIPQI